MISMHPFNKLASKAATARVWAVLLLVSVIAALAVAPVGADTDFEIVVRKVDGHESKDIAKISFNDPALTKRRRSYTMKDGRLRPKWSVLSGVYIRDLLKSVAPEDFTAGIKFASAFWDPVKQRSDDEVGGPTVFDEDDLIDGDAIIGAELQDASKSDLPSAAFKFGSDVALVAKSDDKQFVIEYGTGEAIPVTVELRPGEPDRETKNVRFEADVKGPTPSGTQYQFFFEDEQPDQPLSTGWSPNPTADHQFKSNVNFTAWVRVRMPNGSRGVDSAFVQLEPTKKSSDPPSGNGGKSKSKGGGPSPATGGTPAGPQGGVFQGPSPLPFQQGPSAATGVPPAAPIAPPTLDQPLTENPDKSRIADLAAASGSPGGLYRTVNGIVLAGPSGQPVEGASSAAPGAVREIVETIFDRSKEPRVLWPFLLALLFASWISGAARELKRP